MYRHTVGGGASGGALVSSTSSSSSLNIIKNNNVPIFLYLHLRLSPVLVPPLPRKGQGSHESVSRELQSLCCTYEPFASMKLEPIKGETITFLTV